MVTADQSPSEVVRLLEQCLDLMEGSDVSAVDGLLAQHPEYAPAVRERLALLERTGLLADDPVVTPPEFPETLGEFKLLEPLGRGGMGVVYRARQESLGRDVALKLISPGQLYFPGARERFRREVEAVARLEHPGIARIYTVGEEQGIPYFAMEYVEGLSVDKVLARLTDKRLEDLDGSSLRTGILDRDSARAEPSWVGACFRLTLQVAEALAHAHERGVLHRDMKPSNVMLTPKGGARVLDFGLAWTEGTTPLTQTGSQLGSLPYMAPEQVRGQTGAIGPATDVYALGVTLYEMLTLRSPHHAKTVHGTRQRILAGRPDPISRINRSVPWDAETVCLTAMDPDPARRYPTMEAFADDIRRYLRREPIKARRPSAFLRLRRWIQREPGRATAVLLALLLVVVGPATYALLLRSSFERESQARQEAEENLTDAREARERAEQSLLDAIAAIDEVLEQGRAEDLASSPGADPARRALLERAVGLYEDLLQRYADNELLATRVIEARFQLAHVYTELGQPGTAADYARRGLEALDGQKGTAADRLELEHEGRFALMSALFTLGDRAEFEREVDAFLDETRESTVYADYFRRAVLGQLLSTHLEGKGDVAGAMRVAEGTVADAEHVTEEHERSARNLSLLAMSLQTWAYFGGFHQRGFDYEAPLQRAVELLEEARTLDPGEPMHKLRLASTLSKWVHIDLRLGKFAGAEDRARSADELLVQLLEDYPQRENYAITYLGNVQRLSWSLRFGGDVAAAIEAFEIGLEEGRRILERFDGAQGVAFYLAMISAELARLHSEQGHTERSDELWPESSAYWSSLLDVPHPQQVHLIQAGTFFDNHARHLLAKGQFEQAEEAARRAIQSHESMLELTGGQEHGVRLGKTLPLLAQVLAVRGELDEAVRTLDQGVADGYLDASALTDPELERILGDVEAYHDLVEVVRGVD